MLSCVLLPSPIPTPCTLPRHQYADNFNSQKGDALFSGQCKELKLGVWVNLAAKGARMRVIEYPDLDISGDVSKQLLMQYLAVRVQYTT